MCIAMSRTGRAMGEEGLPPAQAPVRGLGTEGTDQGRAAAEREPQRLLTLLPPRPTPHKRGSVSICGPKDAWISISTSSDLLPLTCTSPRNSYHLSDHSGFSPYLRTQLLLLAFCLEKVCHHKEGISLPRKGEMSKAKPLRTGLLNHNNLAC